MHKKLDQVEAKAALRRAAEVRFKGQPATQEPQTKADLERLLFELSIHQIELEMQNEELRLSQAELDAARNRYFDLYHLAPVGYCTVDETGQILEANLHTTTLLGVPRKRLLEQRLSHFIHRDDQDLYYLHDKQLRATGTPQTYELRLVKPDGAIFWAQLQSATDAVGALICRITLSDITERKRAEEALHASLAEKTTLLQEVHHRVKNNLQIVSSLLNLQAGQVQDAAVLELLTTTRNRVGAMALLHENLYQSENLARLHLPEYVERLCAQLLRAIGPGHTRVRLERQIEPKTVSLTLDQAVPCGLLLNELVTNALKHAFPGDRSGCIRVTLERATPQTVRLTVADDGVGLPATLDPRQTTSLGLRLIWLLTGQLHGTVSFERGQGTAVHILFPNSPGTETPDEI